MKSVLITGCSSGIGLVAARALRGRGHRVFATARKPADVARLQQEGFDAVRLDLSEQRSVDEAVTAVLAQAGDAIDVVIHNAGFGLYGALEDLSRQAIEEQFKANVFGVHQINMMLIPGMRRRGEGRIVIVSSVLGIVAMRFRGLYAASKYALEGLADTLRLELAGSGIRVCLIEPGPIETSFRHNAHEAFLRHIAPQASVHREAYAPFLAGLAKDTSSNRFVLPAEACLPALISAVESAAPRIRYRITHPTRLFAALKRLLPARWLDRLLIRG